MPLRSTKLRRKRKRAKVGQTRKRQMRKHGTTQSLSFLEDAQSKNK